MKNIYKVLLAAVLLGGTTSCADFLEPDPKGQLATKNFFKNQNDLEMALNALYAQVAGSQIHSNPTIVQCQGDDITSTIGSNKSAYLSADAFEEPSDYKGVRDLWLFNYKVIQAANLIIDNAERASASKEYIDMALGNAYFWRAVSYFQLVRVFGPLPVNLHNEPDGGHTPLTSVDKIYDEIIVPDLQKAESLEIPSSYADKKWKLGHSGNCDYWITRQAVKSALTAVYMAMAGYPLERDGYYKMAADKAKEVIDGVEAGTYGLGLETAWNQVYSVGNNWSNEQIVTISYYDVPGNMTGSQFPLCQRFATLGGGWGDFIPEYRWWAHYPAGPRKNAVYDPMIYSYERDQQKNIIFVDWWAEKEVKSEKKPVVSPRHPMFCSMCVNVDAQGNTLAQPYDYTKPQTTLMAYPQNHRFIRYSELLCWFAESAARAGVYTSEAQKALQKVIDRAYNADNKVNASSLTGDALAKQAFLEHGYEVTGYPLALVTRRADQFRLGETATGVWADQSLKASWEYRSGDQSDVIVPKGTETHGYSVGGNKFETINTPMVYTLTEDLRFKEDMPVAATWNGVKSMYHPYPPTEVEKNPNLVRE